MRGMNVLITIRRESTLADNVIGGHRFELATISEHVPARLSAIKPSADLQSQGMQIGKIFNLVVQPSDRNLRERDIIIPENGAWANSSFRVTGVQVDSILPSDPRSHLSVGLSRMDEARSIQ